METIKSTFEKEYIMFEQKGYDNDKKAFFWIGRAMSELEKHYGKGYMIDLCIDFKNMDRKALMNAMIKCQEKAQQVNLDLLPILEEFTNHSNPEVNINHTENIFWILSGYHFYPDFY